MHELEPWPYGELPSATDYLYGSVRYIVQETEDGYYGFAFRGRREIVGMIGPHRSRTRIERLLRDAAPPGMFGG